ncbi:MAG: guanylate kinase [Syntrophomonadaceae bacterium]|jgi:guanylate kinase
MTRKGILFVISGPSGVGKGTIKDAVLERIKDIRLSISVTTRAPRQGEINGREYFFIDHKEFQDLIDKDQLLEWANVYSNRYGTPRSFVMENLEKGQDVLLEIDIQGALQVKRSMPEGVFIFIAPPSIEELQARLYGRNKDSKESILERLAAYQQEMEHMKYYDYVVVNDVVATAADQVEAIIIAERCKFKNMR